MSNQTLVYLFQSELFLARTLSDQTFAEFLREPLRKDAEAADTTPQSLVPWLRGQLALLNDQPDSLNYDELELIEFVLTRAPGLHHLTDFPSAGGLAADLEHLKPQLPERLQARLEHVLRGGGSALPPDATTDLTILNDCHPTWTFFTRQEIIDIRPIVLPFIDDPLIDCFDSEWHQVITTHERYEYDWLAFYYQF